MPKTKETTQPKAARQVQRYSIALPAELLEKVQARARQEDRSLSAQIRQAIRRDLREAGISPPN